MCYVCRHPQCCIWWAVPEHCCYVFFGGRSSSTQKGCTHLQPGWGKVFGFLYFSFVVEWVPNLVLQIDQSFFIKDVNILPLFVHLKMTAHTLFTSFQAWLSELSEEMKETLKHLLHECLTAGRKGEVDPSRYPSQVPTNIYSKQYYFFLFFVNVLKSMQHLCWFVYIAALLFFPYYKHFHKLCTFLNIRTWAILYFLCRFCVWLSRSSLQKMWKEQ